ALRATSRGSASLSQAHLNLPHERFCECLRRVRFGCLILARLRLSLRRILRISCGRCEKTQGGERGEVPHAVLPCNHERHANSQARPAFRAHAKVFAHGRSRSPAEFQANERRRARSMACTLILPRAPARSRAQSAQRVSARLRHFGAVVSPFRHSAMKLLRSSPFSWRLSAVVLQDRSSFSWVLAVELPLAAFASPLKQSDMNAFRGSPERFCAEACALQSVRRSSMVFCVP